MKSITKLLYVCLLTGSITTLNAANPDLDKFTNDFVSALNAKNEQNFRRSYTGKGGKLHDADVKSTAMINIARACPKLPAPEIEALANDLVKALNAKNLQNFRREITGKGGKLHDADVVAAIKARCKE